MKRTRVIVSGTQMPVSTFVDKEIIHIPFIELMAVADIKSVIETIDWQHVDGILFTSSKAIQFLCNFLSEAMKDKVLQLPVLTINHKTRTYAEQERFLDLQSLSANNGRQFAEIISENSKWKNMAWLHPTTTDPADSFLLAVDKLQLNVKDISIYETRAHPQAKTRCQGYTSVDWLVFNSPSAVRAFMSFSKTLSWSRQVKYACIGDTTAQQATKLGLRVNYTSAIPDMQALLSNLK